jgi:hypothetical protein
MDNTTKLWLFIIFVFVILLLFITIKYFGILGLIKIGLLLYVLTIFLSIIYYQSVEHVDYVQPDQQNVFAASFAQAGNWFQDFRLPVCNDSYAVSQKTPEQIELYKIAYRLGCRLDMTEPSVSDVQKATKKLQDLGEQKYYSILRETNMIRIKSIVLHNTVLHDVNTLAYSVYNYNSFDIIESFVNDHLYIYTRDEWDWIIKNKICPWTRQKIPEIVLKTINNRKRLAQYLPNEVFIFPIVNENGASEVGEASEVDEKSNISERRLDLDQVEGPDIKQHSMQIEGQ